MHQARTFIATVHIVAVTGWKRSRKERTGQTEFSTKFAAKRNFDAPLKPSVLFFPFFEILSPMWPNRTKQGFQCRLCLTLRMTLLATILQGLGPIPETTTWKQVNAIKNSFLVTLIKTPGATLFPSFYRWLVASQRTFSGLHNSQHVHTVNCWL
jgi:hypothetical protein